MNGFQRAEPESLGLRSIAWRAECALFRPSCEILGPERRSSGSTGAGCAGPGRNISRISITRLAPGVRLRGFWGKRYFFEILNRRHETDPCTCDRAARGNPNYFSADLALPCWASRRFLGSLALDHSLDRRQRHEYECSLGVEPWRRSTHRLLPHALREVVQREKLGQLLAEWRTDTYPSAEKEGYTV
jgi:hypothetical protein